MKTLYHVTQKGKIEEIMKEGLKPQIGENAAFCLEHEPLVYMCDRKSVPYWAIMLGADAVLEVQYDFKEGELEEYQHTSVNECVTSLVIPPECLKEDRGVITEESRSKAMRSLCEDYIYGLSHICERCACYYTRWYSTYMDVELHDYLAVTTRATIRVMENLDYSVMPPAEIRKLLREAADNGEYTYDDRYIDTKYRLYQMLNRYPSDDLETFRKQLYKLITKKLKGTFRVNTGGWGIKEISVAKYAEICRKIKMQ